MRIILNCIDKPPEPPDTSSNEKWDGIMVLGQLKVGAKARITAMREATPNYRKRLIAMGLLPGTEIEVVRIAPLGDPVEIRVRGYALSLRQKEASFLELEKVS